MNKVCVPLVHWHSVLGHCPLLIQYLIQPADECMASDLCSRFHSDKLLITHIFTTLSQAVRRSTAIPYRLYRRYPSAVPWHLTAHQTKDELLRVLGYLPGPSGRLELALCRAPKSVATSELPKRSPRELTKGFSGGYS